MHFYCVKLGKWGRATRLKFSQGQGAHVVFMNCRLESDEAGTSGRSKLTNEVATNIHERNDDTKSHAERSVFRLHSTGGDTGLKLASPLDRAAHDFDNISGTTFDTHRVKRVLMTPATSEVSIDMEKIVDT